MNEYKTDLSMMSSDSEKISLVSIVICTYNAELFLQQQLNSILKQTYKELEILIVDDASTDATQEIIQQYADADKRIQYFFNETKLGLNKAIEIGVSKSVGEYIAIADQDGIWELNKVEAMINHWPVDCNFIYSLSKDFDGVEPKRNEGNKLLNYYTGNRPQKLFFDSPIHGHACMFQKSLLADALPIPKDVFYDWWLSIIASSTGKVGCVPLTLTYHRIYSSNTSRANMNIQNRQKRSQQLREQRILFIDDFLQKPFLQNEIRSFLLRYKKRLVQKTDNRFSITFFLFYLRNSSIVFHYKIDMSILSLLKNSFRRAFTGL